MLPGCVLTMVPTCVPLGAVTTAHLTSAMNPYLPIRTLHHIAVMIWQECGRDASSLLVRGGDPASPDGLRLVKATKMLHKVRRSCTAQCL